MHLHDEIQTEDDIKEKAQSILARALKVVDLEGVSIEIQVGDISHLDASEDHDGFACVIASPDNKAFIIAISPDAATAAAGLEHIVMHEIVHVAHTMRCGDDDGETIEWLTDQLADVFTRILSQSC